MHDGHGHIEKSGESLHELHRTQIRGDVNGPGPDVALELGQEDRQGADRLDRSSEHGLETGGVRVDHDHPVHARSIDRGRVTQRNFNDYRLLRINEAPKIEVHLVPSDQPPGGIGETGTTAGPPALANAIFAATGVRLHTLPLGAGALRGVKPR